MPDRHPASRGQPQARPDHRANGQYYIEDLRSRNQTFVNSKEIAPARRLLKPDDRIKICDFLFRSTTSARQRRSRCPTAAQARATTDEEDDGRHDHDRGDAGQGERPAASSSRSRPTGCGRCWTSAPTCRGRSTSTRCLTQIADTLFDVFKQADRCFVIMLDESGRPIPKVVKTRRAGAGRHAVQPDHRRRRPSTRCSRT